MKMLKDLTIPELQNILGEGVRLQKKHGGYLAQMGDDGVRLGLPGNLRVDDDGALICPVIDFSSEEEQEIRVALSLSSAVHSFELFVGSYRGGAFWLSQTGVWANHTLVSLYYQIDISGEDDMQNAAAAFLDGSYPLQSAYAPAHNCLAQSQHIIKTPRSLRATMGVGVFGKLRRFLRLMCRTMERSIAGQWTSHSA